MAISVSISSNFLSIALASHTVLITHAYIEVTDLDHGTEFYCGGLGHTHKRQLGPRWVELAGANLPVFLLADRPAIAQLGVTKVLRDFGRHWTPVHLDFIVTKLDEMVGRLPTLS